MKQKTIKMASLSWKVAIVPVRTPSSLSPMRDVVPDTWLTNVFAESIAETFTMPAHTTRTMPTAIIQTLGGAKLARCFFAFSILEFSFIGACSSPTSSDSSASSLDPFSVSVLSSGS
eukprot:CAMPEP_0179129616 /NCGR_PEP_ID=MMETSP0796-20121207/61507_1 /TAXON_ID=73915 /ORGANISM="Pyrodinium bahamense, Strain pbaha01" /LENGTH=116 /DNA_ID=CAMNT_0020828503 /DNA_START=199 /DNA_END=549 /DNA_ORIENTATION=-